jgi:hypothetical protein
LNRREIVTTSDNAAVSVNEMLQAALEAEKNGVPVMWKEVCFKAINAANQYIAELENKAAEETPPPQSMDADPSGG